MRANQIVFFEVALLPFPADAPTAVISDLNPRVTLSTVMENVKGHSSRKVAAASRFDSDLRRFSAITRKRKRIGVDEHARCVGLDSSLENETQDHCAKFRVKLFWFIKDRIDASFLDYDGCVGPIKVLY